MKIISYNEKEEVLLVKFNTHVIWSYQPIIKEVYKKLLTEKDQQKVLLSIARKNNFIGTIKEVNNGNFSS